MDEDLLQAFSNIIRERVSNRHEVHFEGIGVFKVEHENQYQQKFKDGRVTLMPPKDSIVFTSDKRWNDG